MQHSKRYVVTGIGAICALGNNVEEIWNNIKKGKSGIGSLKSVDTKGAYTDKGAEISNFKLACNVSNKELMDDSSLICIEALNEAVHMSKLHIENEDKKRIGVAIGSCTGGIRSIEKVNRDLISEDKEISKNEIIKMPLNRIAKNAAMFLGAEGPAVNIANACAASNIAVSYGCDLIEKGDIDIAAVGGTDSMALLQFAGFHSLHALSEEGCSPFSKSDGLTLGEGAAILIIESYEHALERNAEIICEIAGYGVTSDANHITAPRDDSMEQIKVMDKAVKSAGLEKKDIDYLNAHGTGTALNDKIEKQSIKMFFGEDSKNLKVSSTKAMTGHCLGAASALEAVFCIKAIEDNVLPPTINYHENGESEFDFVPNVSREMPVSTAISNGFAFGGSNASVVFTDKLDREIKAGTSLKDEKVYITGAGILSPIGETLEEFADSINNNQGGIKQIDSEENLYSGRYAANVQMKKETLAKVPRKALRRLDRLSKLLVLSGCQALEEGKLQITEDIAEDIGITAGTSDGPIGDIREFQETAITEGIKEANAAIFPNTVYNASAGYLSINTNIRGNTATFLNGMCSGIDSVCYGYDLLKLEICKHILCGGYDEYNETAHLLYDKCGILADSEYNKSSVYDYKKSGMIISEGAGVLLLENEESARERDAKIYAEVKGYSSLNAPCSPDKLSGNEDIMEECIKEACRKSKIEISDIDAVIGFGNGIKEVNEFELKAYKNVFGKYMDNIQLHNIKSLCGEARGASGSFQIAYGIALLNNKINLAEDNIICKKYQSDKEIKNILITGFAYGGGVSSLVLGKAQ